MAPIILNKKGYQINDNLTYNWELFNSSSLEKVNLILFYKEV